VKFVTVKFWLLFAVHEHWCMVNSHRILELKKEPKHGSIATQMTANLHSLEGIIYLDNLELQLF
jgi:hypothetical protein